jgi:hypothetical protein
MIRFRIYSPSLLLLYTLVGTITVAKAEEPEVPVGEPVVAESVAEEPQATQTPEIPMPPVDTAVQEFLGDAIIQILANPDRVESFKVAYRRNASTPHKTKVAGFPVLEKGPILNETQLQQFQSLVLSEKSYIFEPDKKCMFFPDLGLRFLKGKKGVVEILLSFYCDMLFFKHGGEEKIEDCDPISKPLGEFRDSLFPVETTNGENT